MQAYAAFVNNVIVSHTMNRDHRKRLDRIRDTPLGCILREGLPPMDAARGATVGKAEKKAGLARFEIERI